MLKLNIIDVSESIHINKTRNLHEVLSVINSTFSVILDLKQKCETVVMV